MDCFRSKARTTKNMTTQLPRDQKLVHLTGQAWHEESCTWRHRKKMRQIHTGHERHGPSSSGRRRGDPYFKKEPSVHWHRDVPVQNHIIPSIFRTELTLSDTAGLSHLISPAPTPEPPPPQRIQCYSYCSEVPAVFSRCRSGAESECRTRGLPNHCHPPANEEGLPGRSSRQRLASTHSLLQCWGWQRPGTGYVEDPDDCHARGRPNKETKTSKCATAARPNSKFRMGVEVHRLHAQRVSKTIHGHKTC